MSAGSPPQVTVTGDRVGYYVVVEEHPDGRLVLEPATSAPRAASARRPQTVGSQLASLLSRPADPPPSPAEALTGASSSSPVAAAGSGWCAKRR